MGAKLNSLEAAIVLFKTKTPRGFVSARAVSNPEIDPVASTTTSYIFSILNSFKRAVFTPWFLAMSSLFWCLPTRITSRLREFSAKAVISPSLPSPRTITFSYGFRLLFFAEPMVGGFPDERRRQDKQRGQHQQNHKHADERAAADETAQAADKFHAGSQ